MAGMRSYQEGNAVAEPGSPPPLKRHPRKKIATDPRELAPLTITSQTKPPKHNPTHIQVVFEYL